MRSALANPHLEQWERYALRKHVHAHSRIPDRNKMHHRYCTQNAHHDCLPKSASDKLRRERFLHLREREKVVKLIVEMREPRDGTQSGHIVALLYLHRVL